MNKEDENRKRVRKEAKQRRRFQKMYATPEWGNTEDIGALKKKCRELNSYGDTVFVIDHIDPLLHPLICGLHFVGNMQIITSEENALKSNHFKPYSIDVFGLRTEL